MTDTTAVQEPATPDLDDPSLYFNRELSWLQFNERVIELVEDPAVPLLERLKFCAIVSNNLDEFFMVRVAGLHDQIDAGIEAPLQDGRTPSETIAVIRSVVRQHVSRQAGCLERELRPALAEHGIRIVGVDDVDDAERAQLSERFRRQIFPVLTPLAVGLGRPFPYISNLSLSLGVLVRDPLGGLEAFARVKVPKEMLPRFVPVGDGRTFVPLEDLIAEHLDVLFPGMEIVDHAVFRVTRDADFTVSDEADDLVRAVEDELRRRRFGEVVRVEVGAAMSAAMRAQITSSLDAEEEDVFEVPGPLDLKDLWDVVRVPGHPELRDRPWTPVTQARLQPDEGEESDVLAADAQGRHPPPPPLRLLRHLGRALRRAGGGRPERAGHQADRVPHERRLAAGAGADPRGRARQAGGLRGGGQGPLRRAREHPLGTSARAGRRARRARAAGAQDARQVPAGRPTRGGRRAPLRARRDGQLPPDDRAPVHGLRPADVRRGDRRGRRRHVQLPHRLRAPEGLPAGARRARPPARRHPRRDRAHDRRPPRRRARRASA